MCVIVLLTYIRSRTVWFTRSCGYQFFSFCLNYNPFLKKKKRKRQLRIHIPAIPPTLSVPGIAQAIAVIRLWYCMNVFYLGSSKVLFCDLFWCWRARFLWERTLILYVRWHFSCHWWFCLFSNRLIISDTRSFVYTCLYKHGMLICAQESFSELKKYRIYICKKSKWSIVEIKQIKTWITACDISKICRLTTQNVDRIVWVFIAMFYAIYDHRTQILQSFFFSNLDGFRLINQGLSMNMANANAGYIFLFCFVHQLGATTM